MMTALAPEIVCYSIATQGLEAFEIEERAKVGFAGGVTIVSSNNIFTNVFAYRFVIVEGFNKNVFEVTLRSSMVGKLSRKTC